MTDTTSRQVISDCALEESGPSHKDAQSPAESTWGAAEPSQQVSCQHHTASSMVLGHPGRKSSAPVFREDHSPEDPREAPPTVHPKLSKEDTLLSEPVKILLCQAILKLQRNFH